MGKTVKTVKGDEQERSKCRYIKGDFYMVNRDCFLMSDGRYHRVDNGQIDFDHTMQRYEFISNMTTGVVDFKDGKPVMGNMTINPLYTVISDEHHIVSIEIAKKMGMVMCGTSLRGVSPKGHSNERLQNYAKKRVESYRTGLSYSSEGSIGDYKEYHKGFNSKIKNVKCISDALKDATFGIEFETSNGTIPLDMAKTLGLIPLIDGSLRHDGIEPYEYTTIPLQGEDGVKTLLECCANLERFCEFNSKCALHIHIGSYTFNEKFTTSIYKVSKLIQDELYSMNPDNYRYTSDNGFKQKDYCRPLDMKIEGLSHGELLNDILNKYCSGEPYDFSRRVNHPSDPSGDRKWNIHSRYYGINFIPMLYGKSCTVEFRMHAPTFNKIKVLAWLLITNAICGYASRYEIDAISDELTLDDIVSDIYPEKLSKMLIKYIKIRKAKMVKMSDKGDNIGEEEIINDKTIR